MSKKRLVTSVILGILLVLLFLGLQYLGNNPYFTFLFRSLYRIESAQIETKLLDTGEMEVHETIHYQMRKPFRGVFREISPSRYAQMEGVNLWTEGIEMQDMEMVSLPQGGFSARVWLVPRGSSERLDPQKHPRVTLHVQYRVKNVVENGQDIAQIFRQFWGKWDAPAGLVEGIFAFPPQVHIRKVYLHPPMSISFSDHNFRIWSRNVPPESIAEVRFVMDPLPDMPYAVENPYLYLQEVEKIEEDIKLNLRRNILSLMVVLGIVVLLFGLLFLVYGREPKVDYQRWYEQEPPFSDPPDLVNAIVRNYGQRVDEEGITSALLDLYHRRIIEIPNPGEKQSIRLKEVQLPQDLPPSERKLWELLQEFSSDHLFHFDTVKKHLQKSIKQARLFNNFFTEYQKEITKEAKYRRYFQNRGNILAKTLAIFMIFISLFVVPTFLQPPTAHLLRFFTFLSGFFFFGGGIVLMIPKDVFGRWSKKGRVYLLRWKSFARFLQDYSLLAERPPQSVMVWEKYLIYATALGVAKEAIQNLKNLVPREILERESEYPLFSYPFILGWGQEFRHLHSTAIASIAQAQSSSASSGFGGGFSGGSGGFGGGSGGGRGGAF